MIADSVSETALMVAAYRARATGRPDPICRDEWAQGLAGAVGVARAAEFERHFPHMELWMALRTEYLDRQVRRFTTVRGFDQVVLLGAGFDTRAARLARRGVRFFEVDHPATQAEKRRRLAALSGYPLAAAEHVACDFERGADFVAGLRGAGFATDRPALVLWEGVTPYLTEDAVRGTATRIAGELERRSVVYFDYVGKKLAEADQLRGAAAGAIDQVARMGEPIRWGTNDPLPLLAGCGFREVRTLTFDQIALSITGTYDRDRAFRFQSIAGASVFEPLEERLDPSSG